MSYSRIYRGLVPALAALSAFATNVGAADLGPYSGGRQRWDGSSGYYSPVMRWSGLYGGVQLGYGWGNTDAVSTGLGSGISEAFSYSTSGWLGGVHAGYNWQTSNLVLGIETDLESSGIKGSGTGGFGGMHLASVDWLGSFRARAGFTTGSTLFYLTGGLAYGGVSVDRSAGSIYLPFTGDSQWKTGWTAGLGIEHALTSRISARLEYRYTDLGRITYTSPGAGITDSSDVTQSAVRAGISVKF